MTKPKKPRNKKYVPKGTVDNVLSMFGSMGGAHHAHLRRNQVNTHVAMIELTQGRGTLTHWKRIAGVLNIASVMSEQGFGREFTKALIAAQDAMLEVGKRAVRNQGRFGFTGTELTAINEALEVHDAQLENSRAIDVDRAADEVMRRERHRIDHVSVMGEIRKEAA
jgi:hypothetical protein